MVKRLSILTIILLCGCQSGKAPHKAESPVVTVSEAGAVGVAGDAKTPATVNTKQTGSKMVIPEGSTFVFDAALNRMTLTLSKATDLTVDRKETVVQGPVAFDPPKPPTPGEVADAKSEFWTMLGLRGAVLIGSIAALFGLVRGWNLVMYGGIAVAGGGLFGLFVEKHPAILVVVGIGVALAITGPIVWHAYLKKHEQQPPIQP